MLLPQIHSCPFHVKDEMFFWLRNVIMTDLENDGFTFEGGLYDVNGGFTIIFIHRSENFHVALDRGPNFSVIFTSEALNGDPITFESINEWKKFSPWAARPALVDFENFQLDDMM